MRGTKIEGLWERCALVALCGTCGVMALFSLRTVHQPEGNGLRPHQLVRAINAASGAKVGHIAEVDVRRESRRMFVDVGIFATDGRKYAVRVEGDTGKVLSVDLHPDHKAADTDKS